MYQYNKFKEMFQGNFKMKKISFCLEEDLPFLKSK